MSTQTQKTKHLGSAQADRLEVKELIVGNGRGPGQATGSGDWQSYVPAVSTGTRSTTASVNSARFKIEGKTLTLKYTFDSTAGTGAPAAGAGTYLFTLPPGVVAKFASASDVVGPGYVYANSVHNVGVVHLASATEFFLRVGTNAAGPTPWASTYLPFDSAGNCGCGLTITVELA